MLNKEYYPQTVSVEQHITIKNPKFTIEKNNQGFFIIHDNKSELFEMISTDFFSYHINSEKNIIEISIQWNNRTILSQNEIKLYYNYKNNQKNLLADDNFRIDVSTSDQTILYGSYKWLKISYSVYNLSLIHI